jgi:DNA-binding beta-propeller fold protein YncE
MRLRDNRISKALLKVFSVAFIFVGVFCFVASTAHVYAYTPYQASDVIGQTDSHGDPSYTTNSINNIAAPNASGFGWPPVIAVDSTNHRLYVGDQFNFRVLVYTLTSDNQISSHTPTYVLGQPDFTTADSSSTTIKSMNPGGIAVDTANHRLFVTDTAGNRVLVFDTSSLSNNMDASYVIGQANFTDKSPAYDKNRLYTPEAVAYDSSASLLYVGDLGNRVLVFDMSSLHDGMDASHVLGQTNFVNHSGTISPSRLNFVQGLATDPTGHRLFVGDKANGRVMVFNTSNLQDGMNASYELGQDDFYTYRWETSQSHMVSVTTVSFDANHNRLFVTDLFRVTVFDAAHLSNDMDASYVIGQPDFTTMSGGSVSQKTVSQPTLAYDTADNRLFVGGDFRVLSFELGTIGNYPSASAVLGQTDHLGAPSFVSDNSDNQYVSDNGLNIPDGVAVDAMHHRLFVSDYLNRRVLVYVLDNGNHLVSHTADYVLGQPDPWTAIGWLDSQSNLTSPTGLAYDPVHDRLFVSDTMNNRVIVFNTSDLHSGMNASYVLGQSSYDANSQGSGMSGLSVPQGLAYDISSGLLYVADKNNNRVVAYNTSGLHDGMDASYVLGQPDFDTTTYNDPARNTLTQPMGVDIDTVNHRLFVADSANYRILVFNTSSLSDEGIDADFVLGEPNFTTLSEDISQSGIDSPSAVSYDSAHNQLFVLDEYNSRVMIFDTSSLSNNGIAPDAVGLLGQSDYTSYAPNVTRSGFGGGQALSYDSATNNLWITDSWNNRVLAFDFARLAPTLPDATLGSAYSVNLGSQTQGTVHYILDSGSLPSGLSLDADTGVLSGTPTANGTYHFTATISDNNGVAGVFTDTRSYTMVLGSSTNQDNGNNSSTSDNNTSNNTIPSGVNHLTYNTFQNLQNTDLSNNPSSSDNGSSSNSNNTGSNPGYNSTRATNKTGWSFGKFFSNPFVIAAIVIILLTLLARFKKRGSSVSN